ncbi:SWF or SNF family helicase [Streptomyces sp. MUSC 14]|uniref:SWIM zinc finger family protein n=1 Tax=Streptomyces sp. MUSC 14 TaxID=1354889 RepID=UPI0008F595A0|nr:SWF or SNF family helicase [Streptomyces sp. MUSC 14]OIJ93752.1 SWF or SNF family helicase [Streptomyces sp. MUSC 14]
MNRYGQRNTRVAGRTFAAQPPAHGKAFAGTWWGRSWLRALEDGALDNAAVTAGRRLARAGSVGAMTVRPGRVTAVVREPGGAAHRADVLLPELSEEEWARFLDVAVEQAGHMAALLDRELPAHLIEDAAVSGIDLLPGLGDLEPECDCGTWDHCGHTAALCHQVARLLDEDPFLLLLLRGREREVFLTELHVRGSASASRSETDARVAEGVDAAEAWATGDILPPLPGLPGLPPVPGTPPSLDTVAAAAPGIEPLALAHLADRTAVEAYRLLAEVLRGDVRDGPVLTAAQDAVRLACAAPAGSVTDRLAEGCGRGREGLTAAVRAWRTGGAAALAVLDEERPVRGAALARARVALEAAWEADELPSFDRNGNQWTVPGEGVQLRLDPDGRWWPYRDEDGRWIPVGGPDPDPAAALAVARLDMDTEGTQRWEPAGLKSADSKEV